MNSFDSGHYTFEIYPTLLTISITPHMPYFWIKLIIPYSNRRGVFSTAFGITVKPIVNIYIGVRMCIFISCGWISSDDGSHRRVTYISWKQCLVLARVVVLFCIPTSDVCTPTALHTHNTCSYLLFIHALSLWLRIIAMFNEVSRNPNCGIVLPRENIGLAFCQLVLRVLLPIGKNITLLYSWFCLKSPYLIHSVNSLHWTHNQQYQESWIVTEGSFERTWSLLSKHTTGLPALRSPRRRFGERQTASHFKQWGHKQKAARQTNGVLKWLWEKPTGLQSERWNQEGECCLGWPQLEMWTPWWDALRDCWPAYAHKTSTHLGGGVTNNVNFCKNSWI